MNYAPLLLVAASILVLAGSPISLDAAATSTPTLPPSVTTLQPPPTALLQAYFYDGTECSGEPTVIANETIGVCSFGTTMYPSPDGAYVYYFQSIDGQCDQSPLDYSGVIRVDTLPQLDGLNRCWQFVITNAEYAPPLPVAFPPSGWLQRTEYLNVTSGRPLSTCTSQRTSLTALNVSACLEHRHFFCDGVHQVEAVFTYFPEDTLCQGEVMEVELGPSADCESGVQQFCPAGNTIPAIPSGLAITLTEYGGDACGDYDNNTITLLPAGVCLSYSSTGASYWYDCNSESVDPTITFTIYDSTNCTGPSTATKYPLNLCLPEPHQPNSYIKYTCDMKSHDASLSELFIDEVATASTPSNSHLEATTPVVASASEARTTIGHHSATVRLSHNADGDASSSSAILDKMRTNKKRTKKSIILQ